VQKQAVYLGLVNTETGELVWTNEFNNLRNKHLTTTGL
jgi:hypothetical protein